LNKLSISFKKDYIQQIKSFKFVKGMTMKKQYGCGLFCLIVCSLVICISGNLFAKEKKDMRGWGIDDPYNQFYDAAEVERLKVVVMEIKEVVPLEGMSPAVALVVKEDGEDSFLVHLCPVWYKSPIRIGIKKGDKIKLRGCFAEINDEDVFMAAKIKMKGNTFKVRLSSDGTPFWTMSPAQIQKEILDI